MSLKMALLSGNNIEISEKGILTVSVIDNDFKERVSYQCFIEDVKLTHPQLGSGDLIDYKNGKWSVNFDHSTSLQELRTKTLVNYL